MAPNEIRVGRTYANKGRGKTVRKVEDLVRDSTDTGWYGPPASSLTKPSFSPAPCANVA